MKILFFVVDYWAHISSNIYIAEELMKIGYKPTFVFCFGVKKEYLLELQSRNIPYYVAVEYFKHLNCNDKIEQFRLLIETQAQIIKNTNPDAILIDFNDSAAIAGSLCKVKTIRLTRCGYHITGPFYLYSDGLFIKNMLNISDKDWINTSWTGILKCDCQIVPHHKSFHSVDFGNTYYYKQEYVPNNTYNKKVDCEIYKKKYEIICVLNTSHGYPNIFKECIKVLNNYKNSIILYNKYDYTEYNGYTYTWGDLDLLSKNAKLIISTGGHGISTYAINKSIPQIVLDTAQIVNVIYGISIHSNGCGIFIDREQTSNESINNAIKKIYKDDNFNKRTAYMKNLFNELPDIKDLFNILF